MNETELLKTVWDILESRDLTILKGRKELRAIQYLLHQTQLKLADTMQRLVEGQVQQKSLQQTINERETQIEDIENKLNISEENRLFLLKYIDKLQEELNNSKATIIGMESSKFWQLRTYFLKLKKSLGLKIEE
ncbi:MAG: hypothetical protein ACTMUB_08815 [cyanobacterium endosymbiont of Rhopalodia musculus]|uniref:hypothetical protein n=1 Tax=cyanobacterium endosymbiont of Epithemia clementina EcSB TaxID=3034674 RepID=UPI0024806970|nr:hypothetical protein [cyanobacterium endosymbiont of Epithemia clementina EcSB]WGT68162.1 hypothetical protein P3F56_03595 [cyanobacterium endosymbiont of Epithemia clementina EcSB]